MIITEKLLIFLSVISNFQAIVAIIHWSSVSCPEKWINFEKSCYLLVRDAPVRWHEALKRCNETLSHLVSVNTLPEAEFLSRLLSETDLTRKIWLTSGYLTTDGSYEWSGDGEKFSFYFWHRNDNMEHGFVSYTYSNDEYKWSTIKSGDVGYYVCEIHKSNLYKLRDYGRKPRDYGLSPLESLHAPKAPRFVEEPSDTISYSNGPIHWVELRCRADGHPQPTYKWFKGSSGHYIDPKSSSNVIQVDGNLMINQIVPSKDFGFYFCVASNEYGTIRSRKVALNSAYVKEFPSTRLDVYASHGLGKNVPCQAPDHFPQSMSFAWMYETVKQFLPETERIFISSDGTLYISYLTKGDQKKYSCTIVINELQAGHYGPFFTIKVDSSSNFPNRNDLSLTTGGKQKTCIFFIEDSVDNFKPNIPDEFPRIFPSDAQFGKSAWIECFAYGKPAPKYKWERLDKNLKFNNHSHIIKNFGRKLYFRSLSNSDGGTYRCTAENSQGIAIKEISFTVQSAPIFLNQPQDSIVEIGGSVSLSCEAFGSPKVEYEWFRNGKPLNPLLLPQDDQERIVVDFNRLTIRKTELRDSGCYQCFAANSLGHLSTSAHILVKNFGATLAKEPQNQLIYAFAGTNVILPCKVEGLPKPLITWLYESRPVNYGWQYALTKENHLKIIQVAFVDAGLYTCSTNNIYGTSSISVQLKVLVPLKLDIVSSNGKNESQNDTYTCKVKSDLCTTCVDLPLDFSFNCQNTKQFPHTTFSEQKFVNLTNKLVVNSFVPDFDGVLTCKSDSPAGIVSAVVSVTARVPPKSVVQVKASNVTSSSVTLTWKMSQTSATSNEFGIYGYKILLRRDNESKWEIIRNWIEFNSTTAERYHLDNSLTPNTVYEFLIVMKNKFGWSRQSSWSNLVKTSTSFPFGIVEDLTVNVERPGHILVRWKPLDRTYWASDNIGYIIEWFLLDSSNSSQQSVTLGDSMTTDYVLQVSDISKTKNECVNYSIQVRAFNDQGRGPAAGPLNTSSNQQIGVPRVKIKRIFGSVLNESSANLSWTVNIHQSANQCRQLLAYQVHYWPQNIVKKQGNVLIVPKNSNGCTINGLQSATVYNFQIVPINSAGTGEPSNIVTLETLRRAPKTAPSFVNVNQNEMTKENFIEVSWPAITSSSYDEEMIGYKLHLYENSASLPYILNVFSKDLSSSLPSVRLEQLKSFHAYKLAIQAYNRGGLGPLSEPVIFRFGLNSSGSSISSSFMFLLFFVCLFLCL